MVGNVILFVPYGFTGMFAVRPERSVRQRFAMVLWVGVAIAFALQLAQFFLPSRDENLQDVLWNTVGLSFGAVLAGVVGRLSASPRGVVESASLVPLTLVGAWLVYRLIPFVPSLDLQLIKDSLKPLFALQMGPVNVVHDVAAWLVVAYLLRHVQRGARLDAYLPALIAVVFTLEVIILANVITASNVLGALLAIGLWWGVFSRIEQNEPVLAVCLVIVVAVSGLAPFTVRTGPVDFNWVPFHGFLGGSMYINAQSAVEKVFLYGSCVYLLWRMNVGKVAGMLAATAFVALVEYLQTYFVGHTPEITDPLLVVFAALALTALERQELRSAVDGPARSVVSPRLTRRRRRSGAGAWVAQTVNLRWEQYEFLLQLSAESSHSVSKLTRKIVAQFAEECEREAGSAVRRSISAEPQPPMSDSGGNRNHARWKVQTVNLKKRQFDFVSRLSGDSGVSVSRVIRRIVTRFIDNLDDSA